MFVSLFVLGFACVPDGALTAERDSLQQEVVDLKSRLNRLEMEKIALGSRLEKLQKGRGGADREASMERNKAMAELEALTPSQIYERMNWKPGQKLSVTFETTMGNVDCALWPEKAPLTVLNFVELAEGSRSWKDARAGEWTERPLYDGTIFHRVIPEFMIQGGDPQGTGRGGPGYRFKDEKQPGVSFSKPGLMAMANAGPNTNGSQFFITEGAPTHLTGKHTIFGGDCESMNTVKAIARTKADRSNKPLTDVTIEKVLIRRGG